jgi:hypothetical protein
VAAAELVQRVVRGEHGLDAGVRELLAPGASGLQLLEVPHHVPVVIGRVADVELGEPIGMQRASGDAEHLAKPVSETHG